MARDFLRQINYFQHRRTAPHNSVERQFVLEIANLQPACKRIRQIVQTLEQPRALNGLAQIVVSGVLDRCDRRVRRVKSRHQDHPHPRIALQRLFQECQPIHPRHFQGRHYQAAASGTHLLQGFLGARRYRHGEPRLFQPSLSQLNMVSLVIQYADGEILAR